MWNDRQVGSSHRPLEVKLVKFIYCTCYNLERVFEEHEKPCELMKHWTRDSTNQLRFVERKDKYAMFKNPQVRCSTLNLSILLCKFQLWQAMCGQ